MLQLLPDAVFAGPTWSKVVHLRWSLMVPSPVDGGSEIPRPNNHLGWVVLKALVNQWKKNCQPQLVSRISAKKTVAVACFFSKEN